MNLNYNQKKRNRNGYWRRDAAKTKKMAARVRQEASRSSTRIDDLEKKIEAMEASTTSKMAKLYKYSSLAMIDIIEMKNMDTRASDEANKADGMVQRQIAELEQKVNKMEAKTTSTKIKVDECSISNIIDLNKMKNMATEALDKAEKADGMLQLQIAELQQKVDAMDLHKKIEVLQHYTGLAPAASTIIAVIRGHSHRQRTVKAASILTAAIRGYYCRGVWTSVIGPPEEDISKMYWGKLRYFDRMFRGHPACL